MTDAEGQVADPIQQMVNEAVEEFAKKMTGSIPQPGAHPHVSRWQERDDRRKANARVAREAANARVARRKAIPLKERVEAARTRLDKTNVAGAITLIQEASPEQYDYLILGEKYGQARAGVLKQFGAPRGSVETAYLAEAGLASPEDAQ